MASTTTQLVNFNFGGIRRKDSVFSAEKITCSDCQNVELFFTKLNSGVGIRTTTGNVSVSSVKTPIPCDVYVYDDDELTLLCSTGYIAREVLRYTVDEVNTYGYKRYEEGDTEEDDVTYYAWKKDVNIVYTTVEENLKDVTSSFADGENVIGIFESNQANNTYFFVYTETALEGKLYNFNEGSNTLTTLVSGLSVTGCACGVDFTQGWLDMFVFSNGQNVKYIYSDRSNNTNLVVEDDSNINLTDQDGRTVKGLGLVNFDKRIWIFNEDVLWYSEQGECRNFEYNDANIVTSAGYIEFVKPITAIHNYLGSLAVFHKDSSALVTVDSTTGFVVSDESPGGCASYNSLVFHGTDLYFYDNTKKGVFSFQQIVNGDKTLGNNIAYDIQDELLEVSRTNLYRIRTVSVVTSDRNEVWFLLPMSGDTEYSHVLIFDYIRGEWVKRKCQHINALGVINNVLYSAGKEIYKEYSTETFDDEYIEHFYQCTTLNFGEDNTLKITKFPPRATLDGDYSNNFFVKYVKNYNKLKHPKVKNIKAKTYNNYLYYDSGQKYDSGITYKAKGANVIVKLPSATFKALDITFYTQRKNQNFCIKTLEFSKIKVKQI